MPEPIKLKLVFDDQVGGPGGSGAGPGGAAASGGGPGLFKNILKANVASVALLGSLKAFGAKLVQSSPRLQNTLKTFGKSIELLLRPLADSISLFLNPFARSMLRWAIPYYKKSIEFLKTEKGQKVAKIVGGIGAGVAAGAATGATIGALGGPIGAGGGALIGGLLGGLAGIGAAFSKEMDGMAAKFQDWVGQVGYRIKDFFVEWGMAIENMWTELQEAWGNIKRNAINMTSAFGEWVSDLWAGIKERAASFLGGNESEEDSDSLMTDWKDKLTMWVEDWKTVFGNAGTELKERWGNLKRNVKNRFGEVTKAVGETKDNIIEWAKDLSQGFKDAAIGLKDTVTTALTEAAGKFIGWANEIWQKIKSFRFFGGGGNDEPVNDVIITKEGRVFKTAPDDTIMATKNPGGMMGGGMTINLSINVSAMDTADFSPSFLDRLGSQIDEMLRTKFSGISTEFANNTGF